MKYRIEYSNTYKRSYKRAQKRGLPMDELNNVVRTLAEGDELDAVYITTTRSPASTRAAGSATSSPTGCSSTVSRSGLRFSTL